jgi:hypothetical protein
VSRLFSGSLIICAVVRSCFRRCPAVARAWYARVWRSAPGCWEWDVRAGGDRCTGTAGTWRKAYDGAVEDLAWLGRGR